MSTAKALKNEVNQLKSLLEEKEDEIVYLNNRIKLLNEYIFGRKTEKRVFDDTNQPGLFNANESDKTEKLPAEDDFITVDKHNRLKKGRKPIPQELPRREVIHTLPEDEQNCSCCKDKMEFIGYDVSQELNFIPATIEVIENKREKYACKNKDCSQSLEKTENVIKTAPPPAKIVPKSILSNNFIAHVVVSKFEDANPFYRLEKMTGRYGLNIPRSTMCSLAIKAASNLEDYMKLLQQELLKSHLIGIDETTLQVIQEPDKPPGSKSYMWVFRGGSVKAPIIYYHYSSSRSGEVPDDFLEHYQGKIQTDGYDGYSKLAKREGITHYGCWTHARREFIKVLKIASSHEGANYIVNLLKQLYKVEKDGKKETPEALRAKRIKESLPVLQKLKSFLEEKVQVVTPGSDFGKAINYVLKRWEQLSGYVNDGLVPIDNNLVENAIRPFVVGRKNWLFNYTPAGAEASAVHYTLIETAKANGLEPYSFISYLYNELPKTTKDNYYKLLPMNIDQSSIAPYRKPHRSR